MQTRSSCPALHSLTAPCESSSPCGAGRDCFGHGIKPEAIVAAGNAWDELQAEASAIAAQQKVAELTEWLGCAKIALQVSGFQEA